MGEKQMQARWILCATLLMFAAAMATGCGLRAERQEDEREGSELVKPSSEITALEDGLSTVRFDGDFGFDRFLEQGGASSDAEVIRFLAREVLPGLDMGDLIGGVFGCSTIAVQSPGGAFLFGRNFDWQDCEAMVVEAHPENGYASTGWGQTGRALWMRFTPQICTLPLSPWERRLWKKWRRRSSAILPSQTATILPCPACRLRAWI